MASIPIGPNNGSINGSRNCSCMPQADLFLLFTEPLERAGLSYMVSGPVASMAYGEPA